MDRVITKIAKLTNISPNTVRNYCDRGLIPCKKDFKGWRHFDNPLDTVMKIKQLQEGVITHEDCRKQS